MKKVFYLYILTNSRNSVLYIGTTANLIKRMHEHKISRGSKFTKKYKLHKLVYYELSEDLYQVLHRERLMKKWKRLWKIQLVNSINPKWQDLYPDLICN